MFRPRGSYETLWNASRRHGDESKRNAVYVGCRVEAAEPWLVGVSAAIIVVCKFENEKTSTFTKVGFFRNGQLNHLERKECVGNCA